MSASPSSPHLPPEGDAAADAMSEDRPSRSHESGGRKSSKPLMEKRRRARINHCLTELQSILDALNPENANSRQTKREKADILEQTVRLVKELRQRGNRGNPHDHHSQIQFRAGFNECMATVTHFLSSNKSSLDVESKADLMSHLANSMQCGNKPALARGGIQQPRRRVEDSTSNDSQPVRLHHTQTSGQSETGNGSSSMNIVHPMPSAASTVSPVPVRSGPPTVAVPTPSPGQIAANGCPAPTTAARVEVAPNVHGGATRLVPIGIPIKVQSAGQFLLLPSNIINGNQLATTQIIPVLSPPNSLAPGPSSSSSIGSSGSVAVSPPLEQQSPPKQQSQNAEASAASRQQSAVMYASYPTAALGAHGETTNTAHGATPYPVAFVAMGEAAENHDRGHLQQLVYHPPVPGFYVPANAPTGSEPVWRPW